MYIYIKLRIPHCGDDVGLCQLHHDAARAQLVTGVARFPVVVSGVAVEQGVSASTHSLKHCGTGRDVGNVF